MRYFEGYRCGECGREIPAGSAAGECPACGGPLLGVYDTAFLARRLTRDRFLEGEGSGVWRYRALLPPFCREISLGEGSTPLLPAGRIGALVGAPRLYIKDESTNPTGSFKARGMAVAVSRLVDLGIERAHMPSAGNAGLALAAYSARAGIQARLFIPRETPDGIAEECRAYGADVTVVEGILPDAARRMREEVEDPRSADLSTFREPCRVEGKKTMAFEIVSQCRDEMPEWILYPTGGGTGIVAMWEAFAQLAGLGWLGGPPPRLVVVQASGCAPLVRAFEEGARRAAPCEGPVTLASGIRVPASRADGLILRALHESGGTAVTVTDAQILEAVDEIAAAEGIFPSPEGAATWAGLKILVRDGRIDPAATILLFNTAGGARYRFLVERYRVRGGGADDCLTRGRM